MSEELSGKVALVTGGGRGLGRGLALALAEAGATVAVCGRTISFLQDAVTEVEQVGGRAAALRCDVTDPGQVRACVAEVVRLFGGLDILINNAMGDHGHGRLLDVTEEALRRALESGPMATFRLMQACHPHLQNGGVVVNLASGAGLRPDPAGYAIYGMAKESIRFLSRVAAFEWGSDGIRVHSVVPLADSPALQNWARQHREEAADFFASVPLGRVGDARRDIGRVVVFLCSEASAYMTGGTVLIDGGQARLA